MSACHRLRKHFVHLACWPLVVCALLCVSVAHATEPTRVMLVIDQQHPIYQELIDSLRHEIEQLPGAEPSLSVASLSSTPAAQLFNSSQTPPDLIVTVGTAATAQVSALGLATPMLSVLVPQASFAKIEQQRHRAHAPPNRGTLSAIYVDQPLERRLDLIKLIMPRARRIGLVLGPGNEGFEQELSEAVQRRRLQMQLKKIADPAHLVAALDEVLMKSDVLLGVVDPLVFNRTSAQNVLLTAYRHRVPLIGVSPAYVKAGALAAVYSTPAQIGRQLAEVLIALSSHPGVELPAAQYPIYFSVAVNYQVAESLGLVMDDEEDLEKKLGMPK